MGCGWEEFFLSFPKLAKRFGNVLSPHETLFPSWFCDSVRRTKETEFPDLGGVPKALP